MINDKCLIINDAENRKGLNENRKHYYYQLISNVFKNNLLFLSN